MNDKSKTYGLWKRESKKGNTYYSGKLPNGEYINLYTNTKKEKGDKRPHLNLQLPESLVKVLEPDAFQEQDVPSNVPTDDAFAGLPSEQDYPDDDINF